MADICSICKKKDQKCIAVEWCTECQKALCPTCDRRHKQNKYSQEHDTLSYKDYLQLPPLIKNLNPTCQIHGEKYLYLCREHDQLICNKCLKTEHKKCDETPLIKTEVGKVKTSHAFGDVMCQMNETSQIIQISIQEVKQNLKEIQIQGKEMERHVEDTVNKIITENPTGKILTGQPKGKKLTEQPTGKILTGQPKGKKLTEQPTGKILTGQPKGKKLTEQPTGKILTGQPKGKKLTEQPTGKILTEQPTVKILTEQPTGKILTEQPTGKILTEQPTGKILTELNKLKQDMLSDIDDAVNKTQNELEITMEKLQTMEIGLREIIDQKQSIQQHATNLQTYFGIKEMEKLEWATTKSLKELSENGALDHITIGLVQTRSDEISFNNIELFGGIHVIKTANNQSIETSKLQDAQSRIYTLPQHIQQIADLGDDDNLACCSLPSGLVVAADYKLKLVSTDGTCKSVKKFKPKAYIRDVTVVDENHVATSHPETKTISLVDVSRGRVVRSWSTGNMIVGGISYKDHHIICCVHNSGIKALNIDTGAIDNVINDQWVHYESYVVTGSDRICYTCPKINKVTVLNLNYDIVFIYQDSDTLRHPWCVTLDSNNNVYVAGYTSHNVLFISSDGKEVKSMDYRQYILNGIHYDSHTKQLMFITNYRTLCKHSLG